MANIEHITCIIGTAGHIDHGKTSLVKALTGIDTDRLKEEKKRGVSIDLGFAYIDLEGSSGKMRAALIDVPGHERFIKNMLAGVTGIDFVLFVIAADDGVMPQTREHLDIVRLLGVKKGIFVITKSDLVGLERITEVRGEIEDLISPTHLTGSPILSASVLTGKGLPELKELIKATAVDTKRLLEKGFFRLPVDRSFVVKGFGTVVTGTVASGSVSKGEEVICFPTGQSVKVRGIQSLFLSTDSVSSGQRAAVNISGVNHKDIERGFLLSTPELKPFADNASLEGNRFVDCTFEFIKAEGRKAPVKNRSTLKVHHLTGETLAKVHFAGGLKEAMPGEKISGRLIFKKPLLMLRGDRFILRDPSVNSTIGGGVVEFPYLSKWLLPKLNRVNPQVSTDESLDDTLLKLLPVSGLGLYIKTISLMLNMPVGELSETLKSSKAFFESGEFIIHKNRHEAFKKEMLDKLSAFHKEKPMEAGLNEDAILKDFKKSFSGLDAGKAIEFFKYSLDKFINERLIKREGTAISLLSHTLASKGDESKVENAIMGLFSDEFTPPNIEDIRKLPFDRKEVERVLAFLQRAGVLVKLKEGSFLKRVALNMAKDKMAEHIKAKGSIRAAEFRDLLGCGRKLAIEILEYFDKERVTLRQGDIRTLR
ncbi:MAG: selenocysteine-specific translation elongation factor [Deltaproteobacteria bacterium]|nr:selenocysteine-specific translation elongation factor [Deltaproteobacteria bacterium]